jgi:transcriptional regulator with XRE-family HTH domain
MTAVPELDYPRVAAELLRALRGARSQTAASRRIGHRSNVLYTWESGRRWPTAARFLRFAERMQVDVRGAIVRFYGSEPAWLARTPVATREGVAALLDDLRAQRSIAELARATGKTRSSVSRWLSGRTEPRLPDFLRLLEASSLRMLDFVAELAPPASIPALAARWLALEAARKLAYDAPWTHAVLRALELHAYQRLPAHQPGWIAARLGIAREQEDASLRLLQQSGQIARRGGRFVPRAVITVDTRRDARAERSLKRWTTSMALERLGRDDGGQFSTNLFTVSARDFERLRELQRSYFRQLRAIVAESEPAERVAIVNVQLFGLDR